MSNIISSLTMRLDAEGLNYKKASDFQGVLFNHIDYEYGEYLHRQQLHPYSQYIYFEDDVPFWRINVTDTEAYENIIVPFLRDDVLSFVIKNGNINVNILDKELEKHNYSELLDGFYNNKADRRISLEFRTVTSFKQRGRYNITPDLRLIYQSLMMKYSAVGGNANMMDEDALDDLVMNSGITSYRLFSARFPMEGQNVPGFLGKLTVGFYGPDTMARYARMLFQFGEYSGIGIKCGMGMGAFRILREKKNVR